MKKIRIIIVDDHRIFAEGVADILQHSNLFEVAEVVDSIEDIPYKIAANLPDIVLLDLNIKGKKSISVIQAIKKDNPKIIIIILSMYDEPTFVKEAREMGANGYILKDAGRFELLDALEQCFRNPLNFVYKGKVKNVVKSSSDFPQDMFLKKQSLSGREVEVIKLLSEDKSYLEVASILFLSEMTVKTHVRNIRHKLGIKSKAGLVKFYFETLI